MESGLLDTPWGVRRAMPRLVGRALAVAGDDQQAPAGEAYDDADEQQRFHRQVVAADLTHRAGGDKRERAQHDQGDSPPAQAARSRGLGTAGVPPGAVAHRHRQRVLPWL